MRRHFSVLFVLVLFVSACAFAQTGEGNECTPAGTWYGGSVVSYQMTLIPAGPAGHYIMFAEGMYKNSVMNTIYTGHFEKNGKKYEGSMLQLSTTDADFLKPPPIGKLPDIYAGWSSMEMVDCNTIKNTIPMFGIYFGAGIWQPGVIWNPSGKVPMVDAPDVDLVDVLGGGHPIVETYHRLVKQPNTALFHK